MECVIPSVAKIRADRLRLIRPSTPLDGIIPMFPSIAMKRFVEGGKQSRESARCN